MSPAIVDLSLSESPALADRARSLIPLLRQHSAAAERDRRLTPEVVDALREAGLFRMSVPKSHGGDELSVRDQAAVILEIGRGCASAGWLVGITGVVDALAPLLPESGAGEMFFATPDVFVCNNGGNHDATATEVQGGYRVTGRFPTVSGCEIGDWMLMVTVPVVVDGELGGELVSMVAPLAAAHIERTWDVAGMLGTGSHTVEYEDLFVPENHAIKHPVDPQDGLLNLPKPEKFVGLAHRTIAALVGAAYGALDTVQGMLAKGKPLTDTIYGSALESPVARHWLAEAVHLLDTAYGHLLAAADLLDASFAAGDMSRLDRTRARRHMTSAIDRSREAISLLLDLGGTGGFATGNPLQRYWRDFETGSHHAHFNKLVSIEDYTRALLRIDPAVSVVH
ncbi:acyl-CoA dehydrogenase family protein [Nocardia sp. NPDC057663]|uniref:acyl-CoA dehydrogenase family protein n=1 Tax=Nocardia sp. NPDC057663 TaxID=3346201 RepID=UPI00366BA83E